MKKKLVKEYIIQVFEVTRETKIDKTEAKEELAKIVTKVISNKKPKYIPDEQYNNWCKNELPKILKEKYDKYMEQKDGLKTQKENK